MITRSRTRNVALAAALSATGAAAILGTTSHADPAPAGAPLQVTQVVRDLKFEDVAPRGGVRKPFSQGDAFVIGGRLLRGGKPVGTSSLVCTTTRPGREGGSVCVGTLVLPGGQITFSGYNTVKDVPETDFAITGGTGTYAGAHGVLRTKNGPKDTTVITVN